MSYMKLIWFILWLLCGLPVSMGWIIGLIVCIVLDAD